MIFASLIYYSLFTTTNLWCIARDISSRGMGLPNKSHETKEISTKQEWKR